MEVKDKNNRHIPTADNEITFSIQGPGKIIGVGNGDPTSLEKDKYIETIATASITNLKEKQFNSLDNTIQTTDPNYNDSDWKTAYKDRDYYNLPKYYVYRGTFNLPNDITASQITFFYKQIGVEQSIYINGKPLGSNIKQDTQYLLDKTLLKPGNNNITIIATPIGKKHDWDFVNQDPGLIQIFTQPSSWKRKLFNGYAQVIVQATKEAGKITLTATSNNLKQATLNINSIQ